ncbi:SH3 domain-containing protein [Ochrobactrum sp. GPK 3]|uniref:SH3 domain-containing protein n=1 Tax=Brucella sp. 22210 TaxID=3453892 RepID=UPI00313854BC
MKPVIASCIATFALLLATNAEAATGLATATINLRAGPGTSYPSMGSIPNGVVLNVAGCTNGYGWCRVNYQGIDGWASSRYIAVRTGGGAYTTNSNFGPTAAAIGIPLIAGMVIGFAVNNNQWHHSDSWGPRGYRRDPWGKPRPHWTDRPGWSDRPGYHHNFYGPGDRWRPRGAR